MNARRSVVLIALLASAVLALLLGRLRRRPDVAVVGAGAGSQPRITRATDTTAPPPQPTLPPFDPAFDCSDLELRAPPGCVPHDDALLELVHMARGWSMGAVWCMPRGDAQPTEPAMWQKALERFAASDLRALPRVERIVAQNAVLRIGLCAVQRLDDEARRELERRAAHLVEALALSGPELTSMGSALPPELGRWLGPIDAWSLRVSPWSPGYHELGYGLTKRSRPVSAPNWFANVGLLVAVDRQWKSHVTSILGSMELRRSRPDGTQQICATSLDVNWLRCKAPLGLRPLSTDAGDGADGLVFATGNARVRCTSCHRDITLVSREASDPAGGRELDFSTMLGEKLAHLKRALDGP